MRITRTDEFDAWLDAVPDERARGAMAGRIARLASGVYGDAKPIGDGVGELRVHVGAGWRIYYVRDADTIVLLCGGSKRTQHRDIQRAKMLAKEL